MEAVGSQELGVSLWEGLGNPDLRQFDAFHKFAKGSHYLKNYSISIIKQIKYKSYATCIQLVYKFHLCFQHFIIHRLFRTIHIAVRPTL